ncbi:MAG: hypothetical protein VX528_09460, partial [Candidatus Latescibacterota bacterium]|nr:hypothetical protein [Candidatus Latescibacterota bacterium]
WEGPSLPGVLRNAGYQTEWVGRGMHQTPPDKRYGFDHMVFKDHRVPDDYDTFLAGREPGGGGVLLRQRRHAQRLDGAFVAHG